jgi:branched-subunit amino acid transport protein AzlD
VEILHLDHDDVSNAETKHGVIIMKRMDRLLSREFVVLKCQRHPQELLTFLLQRSVVVSLDCVQILVVFCLAEVPLAKESLGIAS